jgi:hypothetical protein
LCRELSVDPAEIVGYNEISDPHIRTGTYAAESGGVSMPSRAPLAVGLFLLFALLPARAEVPTLLLFEGGTMPGDPSGDFITALNNTGVNHGAGYAEMVNTFGTTALSHAWGGTYPGAGTVLRTEKSIQQYKQTSFESFFGIDDQLGVCYSPVCDDTVNGYTSLDAVYLGDAKVMVGREPYPHLAGKYWSYGSRPSVTANGVPYFAGGFASTPGGSTQNRGLFYGWATTPLLLGGMTIVGLPDTLGHSATMFDYRLSANGGHYISNAQTVTGSSLNDDHVVIDGAVALAGGLPVSENGPVPAAAGGLPGELWDNFDLMGVTNAGRWMFTGDTNANALYDEFVAIDGNIAYREGDTLDGEVLSGAIEGAYMNEDGDVAFIWDIQGGALEALYLDDQLLVREGDPVDLNGDGIPDGGTALTDFTGISALTLSDRDPSDGSVRLYFTADYDQVPTAIAAAEPAPVETPAPELRAEALGLSEDEMESLRKGAREGARVIQEGYFVVAAMPTITGMEGPSGEESLPAPAPSLSVSPNPFRPGEAEVRYAAPAHGPVTIDVYDIAGRHVRSLVAAGTPAGTSVLWDGRDDLGREASPGVYFVRVVTGTRSETKRISLVR